MKKHQIYIFIGKKEGFPMIFNVAVKQEAEAKKIVRDCLEASLKVDCSLLTIKEESPAKENELFVLLEDRMMDGKFYPTGEILRNKETTQKWMGQSPLGVERRFEEVEVKGFLEAINTIFQNS